MRKRNVELTCSAITVKKQDDTNKWCTTVHIHNPTCTCLCITAMFWHLRVYIEIVAKYFTGKLANNIYILLHRHVYLHVCTSGATWN